MISEQYQHFKNIVESAKRGNKGAIKLVRTICRNSCDEDAAPDHRIIQMAELLLKMREEDHEMQQGAGEN